MYINLAELSALDIPILSDMGAAIYKSRTITLSGSPQRIALARSLKAALAAQYRDALKASTLATSCAPNKAIAYNVNGKRNDFKSLYYARLR